jgi:hypothetical protein
MKIPAPRAKVGDIIVGDLHPKKGTVMFEVDHAYRDDNFHWVYVNFEGDKEINELWIDYIFRKEKIKEVK